MQTVAETSLFVKQAAEERSELIDFLAVNPQAGDEIPGAGGRIRVGNFREIAGAQDVRGRYQSPTSIELRSHHILNALSCAFASKSYH